MDTPSLSIRSLARLLLSLEAEGGGVGGGGAQRHAAVRVIDKVRSSLTRFAGLEGFASLLGRSLTLARRETPALKAVTFNPNGSLEGIDALVSDPSDGGPEAVVEVVAHLLGLLVSFIGEPLTLRIVRESWPDARLGE